MNATNFWAKNLSYLLHVAFCFQLATTLLDHEWSYTCQHSDIIHEYHACRLKTLISRINCFKVSSTKFLQHTVWRGTLGGIQYRKKNWQIPKCCVKNQRNTDTAFMITHVYLKLYPSGVFVYLCIHQKSTSDIARKREKTLIGRMIEKPSHWTPFQFHHRLCNQ